MALPLYHINHFTMNIIMAVAKPQRLFSFKLFYFKNFNLKKPDKVF